jgi:hypothetical protein
MQIPCYKENINIPTDGFDVIPEVIVQGNEGRKYRIIIVPELNEDTPDD